MDPTTILAGLAAIAAFAGAIKALPIIWKWIKGVGRFLAGTEKIALLPGIVDDLSVIPGSLKEISCKVDTIRQELKDHMAEEERMRAEEKNMVQELAESIQEFAVTAGKQTIDVAEAVFKQATFADEVAYYIVDWDDEREEWMWRWGNPAYFELTGLTEGQAAGGQYWDIIDAADRDRVLSAANWSGEQGVPLEVDFVNVNVSTGERTLVRVLAAPVNDRTEQVKAYLGSIHKV